jgi:drug/metabolite transporter (DMT)-like permease
MCVFAVCMLLIGGAVFDGLHVFPLPSAPEALSIVYLGAVVSVVGLVCWGFGLARLGPERFGLFSGATPVVALLTSAALGLSTITGVRMLGCLVVAAAMAVGMSVRPPATGAADNDAAAQADSS